MRLIRQKNEQVKKLQRSVIFRQPERLYDAYVQKLDHLRTHLLTKVRQVYDVYDSKEHLLRQRLLSLNLSGCIQRYQAQLKQDQRLLLSHMSSQYDSKLARFEKKHKMRFCHWIRLGLWRVAMLLFKKIITLFNQPNRSKRRSLAS